MKAAAATAQIAQAISPEAMPSTPTPKRPRSPTASTNHDGEEEVPSSAIGYFLSSVKKSVTKRMRIGYDYLGGGGTANGQTEGAAGSNGGGGATAAGDLVDWRVVFCPTNLKLRKFANVIFICRQLLQSVRPAVVNQAANQQFGLRQLR